MPDQPIGLVSDVSFSAGEPCERISMNRDGMHPSTCESDGERVVVMAGQTLPFGGVRVPQKRFHGGGGHAS